MNHRSAAAFYVVMIWACAGAASAGCVGGDAESVRTTVVGLHADGTIASIHEYVASPEQYAQEVAEKRTLIQGARQGNNGGIQGIGESSSAISSRSGSSCLTTDLWVYDLSDCNGNRICFYDAGTESLWNHSYWLCDGATCFSVTWARNVYSYWEGDEAGYFYNGAWQFTVSFPGIPSLGCKNTNLCNGVPCDAVTLY